MEHKPHIFANRQHIWQHYVAHPCCQPVFQILYLNTKKKIGGMLKLVNFI